MSNDGNKVGFLFFKTKYPSISFKKHISYNTMLSLDIVQLLKPIYTTSPPSITNSISLVTT